MIGSPYAVMRSIFIGSPPIKTVFPFLFSDLSLTLQSIRSMQRKPCDCQPVPLHEIHGAPWKWPTQNRQGNRKAAWIFSGI